MKKIMFNDRYGLTEAVLSGRKTQTRRLLKGYPITATDDIEDVGLFGREAHIIANGGESLITKKLPYQVGEIVAIAQSYKDAGVIHIPCEDDEFGCYDFPAEQTNGWTSKMFVRSDLMPHQIRITNVRVERLQNISDEDCIKELGLDYVPRDMGYGKVQTEWVYQFLWDDKLGLTREYSHRSPKEVFAVMIDKICGGGTWSDNPYVFAYDFELVK